MGVIPSWVEVEHNGMAMVDGITGPEVDVDDDVGGSEWM